MALLLFYIPRKSEKAKLARILHLIENKLIDSLRLERVQSFHGKIQGTGEYKLILRIFNRDQEEEIVYKKQFFTIIAMAIFTVLIGVIAVQASPDIQGYYGFNNPLWGNMDQPWNYNYNNSYNYTYNNAYSYSPQVCNQCTYACNRAEFVKDVTVPDGSYIAPGASFTKTWRIRNTGTTTWTTANRLVFSGGDSLGAPSSVAFPYSVSPGYWMDISVPLRAPNAAGTFQGNWMLQSSDGTLFGVGCNGQVPIWVKISTVSNSCATVAYSCNNCNVNYCNPACYGSYYNQITKNPYCNNKIRSVNDITIPDDTEMDPGTSFRKTWSMKNGGTCVWNEGYSLIFSGGDAMGWKTPVFLPNPVYPGETVEISIDLKAPNIPGDYRGYYKLRDNLGFTFGYGSYANKAFWVDIKVTGSPLPPTKTPTPTPRPTATPTPTSTPAARTAAGSGQELSLVIQSEDDDSLVEPLEDPLLLDDDESEADLSNVLEEGEGVNSKSIAYNACGKQRIEINFNKPDIYNITWYVTNAGSAVWNSDKYRVVNSGLSDNLVMMGTDITVPATNPGEEAMVSMSVKVKDVADQSDRWLKYYLTDGNESFCEVYFSLPIF